MHMLVSVNPRSSFTTYLKLAVHCFGLSKECGPGAWATQLMTVIPTLWEAEEGRSLEVRSLRSAWSTWWNPISTKNTKISWAWWWVPVIPAPQEAEARELLEPGRRTLQWSEITPLHWTLVTERLCLKNKTKLNKKKQMSNSDEATCP